MKHNYTIINTIYYFLIASALVYGGVAYFNSGNTDLNTPLNFDNPMVQALMLLGLFTAFLSMVLPTLIIKSFDKINQLPGGHFLELKQGDLEISVSSFSNFSDMVNYELL